MASAVRVALGWSVVALVSLVSLAIGILAVSLVARGNEQAYVGAACGGIIAGIAGGLRLKDRIVRSKARGA